MRTMKEHAFFLEAGFPSKDANRTQEAENFKNVFTALLAEKATEFYTGVSLNTDLTRQESSIVPSTIPVASPEREQAGASLNSRAIQALDGLISYKAGLLDDMLSCRIYTTNYPLLSDHIMREARLYHRMLIGLQSRIEFNMVEEAVE